MKAVEFIKQYGWGEVKRIISNSEPLDSFYNIDLGCYISLTQINYGDRVSLADLKQYVDAYELVQKFGGLQKAKSSWNDFEANREYEFYGTNLDELKEAITLVEEVEGVK